MKKGLASPRTFRFYEGLTSPVPQVSKTCEPLLLDLSLAAKDPAAHDSACHEPDYCRKKKCTEHHHHGKNCLFDHFTPFRVKTRT